MLTAHWKVIGASVQGTSHLSGDVPCQDAHGYQILEHGTVVAAVSDGAGSAEHAAVASEICARVAMEEALADQDQLAHPDPEWMKTLYARVRQNLERYAEDNAIPLAGLAATLTVVVISGGIVLQGSIGDSGAIFALPEDEFFMLCSPQKGEYVNQTVFLNSDHWAESLEINVLEAPVEAFLLCTDGLLDVLLRRDELDAKLISPLFQFAAHSSDDPEANDTLAAFLRSPKITCRIDDDVTLVLGRQNTTAPV